MAKGGKQREEFSLRLWRRGGPVRAGVKGEWPFGTPTAPGMTQSVPVLWREYGWACEMDLMVGKRRPVRAEAKPLRGERGSKPLDFDCSALTAPLVPVCAFGIEMTNAVSCLSWL